jgi:hypothetical protein
MLYMIQDMKYLAIMKIIMTHMMDSTTESMVATMMESMEAMMMESQEGTKTEAILIKVIN